MRKFSTRCVEHVMEKQVEEVLVTDCQPSQRTVDFLRQFARVYHVEPTVRSGLCGFVLN